LLFAIPPIDRLTYIGSTLGLDGVVIAGALVPARRAARLDPTLALKCE
jgi:hypothetical protein